MISRVIHCGLCKCIHSWPRSRAVAPLKPYLRRWTQARMQQSQQFLATPLYRRLLELLLGLPLFRLCTAQLLCPAQVAWKALCLLSQHAAVILPLRTTLNDFSEKRCANGWKKNALNDPPATEEQDAQRRDMSGITVALRMNRSDARHVSSPSEQCVQFIIYERLHVCLLRAGKSCFFCDLIKS